MVIYKTEIHSIVYHNVHIPLMKYISNPSETLHDKTCDIDILYCHSHSDFPEFNLPLISS
jgi:hypothetical protein